MAFVLLHWLKSCVMASRGSSNDLGNPVRKSFMRGRSESLRQPVSVCFALAASRANAVNALDKSFFADARFLQVVDPLKPKTFR